MTENLQKAAEIIQNSRHAIALTGAGISVESGIPDFRSAGGLWEKYDPSFYANIQSFKTHPEKVWDMIFDMVDVIVKANPNPAHGALAQMEKMGLLKAIITQNIDNLHQEAGSKSVVEYHGNAINLECPGCFIVYSREEFNTKKKKIPKCKRCNRILKPTIIFFGEGIPLEAMNISNDHAGKCDVVLVIGTSAIVYPAASIPVVAKRNGAKIIEFNLERTELSSQITDVFIQGSAGETLPKLIGMMKT